AGTHPAHPPRPGRPAVPRRPPRRHPGTAPPGRAPSGRGPHLGRLLRQGRRLPGVRRGARRAEPGGARQPPRRLLVRRIHRRTTPRTGPRRPGPAPRGDHGRPDVVHPHAPLRRPEGPPRRRRRRGEPHHRLALTSSHGGDGDGGGGTQRKAATPRRPGRRCWKRPADGSPVTVTRRSASGTSGPTSPWCTATSGPRRDCSPRRRPTRRCSGNWTCRPRNCPTGWPSCTRPAGHCQGVWGYVLTYRYWPASALSVLDTRADTTLARLMIMPFTSASRSYLARINTRLRRSSTARAIAATASGSPSKSPLI